MGLLEQLMERLEKLNARLDAIEGIAVIIENQTTEPVTVVGTETIVPAAPTETELDSNGLPWDERIHAGTKRKNADQSWSRRKGINDLDYNTVVAELKAAASTPDAPAPVTTTTAPVVPAKPGIPAKPGVPVKPGVPAAPKKASIEALNTLTNDFGVDYDLVTSELFAKHGATTYNEIPATAIGEVMESAKKWVESLTSITDECDTLNKLAEGTDLQKDVTDGVNTFIETHGGKDGKIGTVPYSATHALFMDLATYANQWDDYFKSLTPASE